jgi:hypothetical protein
VTIDHTSVTGSLANSELTPLDEEDLKAVREMQELHRGFVKEGLATDIIPNIDGAQNDDASDSDSIPDLVPCTMEQKR